LILNFKVNLNPAKPGISETDQVKLTVKKSKRKESNFRKFILESTWLL